MSLINITELNRIRADIGDLAAPARRHSDADALLEAGRARGDGHAPVVREPGSSLEQQRGRRRWRSARA